MKVTAEPNVTN